MIGLVTDSASQIPAAMADRLRVAVVPVIVTVDGVDHREGVDLAPDEFWERFGGEAMPAVSTSQPSPGAVADVYRGLVERGADEIVSVHVGAEHSGTLNSARLAADQVDVPVHLVDSATASFGVTCCVWEAAIVIGAGGTAAAAASAAARVAPRIGTTFIIQALDFARRGGRFDSVLPEDHDGIAVLGGRGGVVEVLAVGSTLDELCDLMVAPFLDEKQPIRAGVCLADDATAGFTRGIEKRLRASGRVVELVRYRVGPSIAAHTGPGTAGGFWYPIDG